MSMYDELGGYGVVIILVIILLVYLVGALFRVLGYLLAGLYTVLAALGTALLAGLDALFSAPLFAGHPEVGWAIGGLLIGAGVGAWTIAPVYGLRRARPIVLILPLLLVLGLCGYGLTRPQPLNLPLATPSALSTAQAVALQLRFTSVTQESGASLANFKLGAQELAQPFAALQAKPGEPDTPLSGGSDSALGPFTLRVAPRHGGVRTGGSSDRYNGSYMLQLLHDSRPVTSFGVALPGELVQWDRSAHAWTRLGDGRQGELDIHLTRELGLARLLTSRSDYVLHVELKASPVAKHTAKSRYSVDVASFPQGELTLRLEPTGPEQLIPATERRVHEEELLAKTFAKPLAIEITFERVTAARDNNPYSSVTFMINGQRTARLEPLNTTLAVQSIQRGALDTQTEYRDLDHGLWYETPEFRALVRFCCEPPDPANLIPQTIRGSYVVTVYSRRIDFNLSFRIDPDGALVLIQQPAHELEGLRTGKGFVAVPAAQFSLPGNPPYVLIRFSLQASTQHSWSGNTGVAYEFASGKLFVESALHPRPRP
jgi:hypothetical protein